MMAKLGLTREQVESLHRAMTDLIAATGSARTSASRRRRLGTNLQSCQTYDAGPHHAR